MEIYTVPKVELGMYPTVCGYFPDRKVGNLPKWGWKHYPTVVDNLHNGWLRLRNGLWGLYVTGIWD